MHRLLRAARYLPSGISGGRRVAGPDEDRFTLLASALERVVRPADRRAHGVSVSVIGDFPATQEWALAAVVGSAPRISYGSDAAPPEGSAEDRIVVMARGPLANASPGSEDAAAGDASVALLYRSLPEQDEPEFDGLVPPAPATERGALALNRQLADRAEIEWIGDWTSAQSTGWARDVERDAAFRDIPAGGVSEGAYIPRPRYLESLGSRWRFEGDRCGHCSHVTFPARGVCRSCGRSDGLASEFLPRDDVEVIATTTIGAGGQPTEFDRQVESFGPYEVVLAELAPGIRVTLPVTDVPPGSIRIGDRVDTRLRRLYPMDGEWRYGRKAVPRPPG